MVTKNDIPKYLDNDAADVELPNGWTARVRVERDDDMGAPWEEHDGHGEVSEWTTRDKRPGEWVLAEDRGSKRFYDFATAVATARKDGWDAEPYGTGTNGERAVRAATADFNRLRAWCNDQWQWVWVRVELFDADDESTGMVDTLGGIESDGDYWRECTAEMINDLAAGIELPNFEAATGADTLSADGAA